MSKKINWAVWSGEGEEGSMETKTATLRGIKRILTSERCGGDRWAHACPAHYEYADCCNAAKEFDLASCTEGMIDKFYITQNS